MFTLSVQSGGKYLLMVMGGEAGLAEICATHDFMCEMSRRMPRSRLLIDMLGLTVNIGRQQYEAALEHLRCGLPTWTRLAVVVHPQVTRGMAIEIALERGVPAEEFATLQAAEAWLVADEVAAAARR